MSYNTPHKPKCYAWSLTPGNIKTLTVNQPLWYIQLENTSSYPVTITLNGDSGASFILGAGITQILNQRDMDITSFVAANGTSGGGTVTLDVMVSYIDTAPVVV